MDRHAKEFFTPYSEDYPHGTFCKVIALHDAPDIKFEDLGRSVGPHCKGWLELAQLPTIDRIDLVREYWLYKMKKYPRFTQFLFSFFDTIDDIGIFLTQHRPEDRFQCHMVYSLPNDTGYYRGSPPATEESLLKIQDYFTQWVLPSDYLAFLQIHDGFAKATDCTGLTPSSNLIENYEKFQKNLEQQDSLLTSGGKSVDFKSLIPFYESFGMPFYQCFWGEWHPEDEMGNVYYSGLAHIVYEADEESGSEDKMAFPTFVDWLLFYLERID